MTYTIQIFDDLDTVRKWVEENLEDMCENSTYHFSESEGFTYIHFISQQDAWDFEEYFFAPTEEQMEAARADLDEVFAELDSDPEFSDLFND